MGGGNDGGDDEPPRKDVIDDKRDGIPPKPKSKAKAKRRSARSASNSPQPRGPDEYTPARERHADDPVRRLHPGAGAWTPADLLSIGRARVEERQLGMGSPPHDHSESFSNSWFAASTATEREAAFNRMVENRARVLAEEAELHRLVEIRARRRARERRSKSVVRIADTIPQPDEQIPERAVETGAPTKKKKKPRGRSQSAIRRTIASHAPQGRSGKGRSDELSARGGSYSQPEKPPGDRRDGASGKGDGGDGDKNAPWRHLSSPFDDDYDCGEGPGDDDPDESDADYGEQEEEAEEEERVPPSDIEENMREDPGLQQADKSNKKPTRGSTSLITVISGTSHFWNGNSWP